MKRRMSLLDRIALTVSPRWGLQRIRAKSIAATLRHYEAAQFGRRTQSWNRSGSDANVANARALHVLRNISRDLHRNNGWAKNGIRAIVRNTVGWGILPNPTRANARTLERVRGLWRDWADSTQCDYDERLTFAGLQRLAMQTVAISGEVLIRRIRRRARDGLTIPLQIQVLEPDFLDTNKDGISGPSGGPIIQGVEFDKSGKRVAYWLFGEHPGSRLPGKSLVSQRIPATDVIHVYRIDRPGQVRGISWLATAISRLKDLDEYEDALLMRQKIAACFAAFVTDVDGAAEPIGEVNPQNEVLETIEPGLVSYLPPGRDVTFSAPPPVTDDNAFSEQTLRQISAGLGTTYEDLTGDYSKVNFSSARMSRLAHWANVHEWRWDMLIPILCQGVWGWTMDAAVIAGEIREAPAAEWTPPPMPMIEPEKEGLAYQRLIRAGSMTHDEMVRELGKDPDTHWKEYAEGLDRLDKLGIWLDSDTRRVSAAGLAQERVGQKKQEGGGENAGES